MPKIGIIFDTYKLPMFKKELDAAGVTWSIDEISTAKFSNESHTVITCISEQHIIQPITQRVTQWWTDYFNKQKQIKKYKQ